MESKKSPYLYEHNLKNSSDVIDTQSLYDIDHARFYQQNKIIVDYTINARTSWNNQNAGGSFKINYDVIQIKDDVITAYQQQQPPIANSTIDLSQNNILSVTPVAAQNSYFSVNLSELITDILPKIKIPVLYKPSTQQNTPASVEVSPKIFIDDGTVQNPSNFCFPNAIQGEIYHEMTIAGDANIIWDSCRDFVE
jgi:hypothetical protein